MAMTKCKECSREISSKATACPHCGAKVRRTTFATKAVAFMIVLVIVLVTQSNSRHEETAAKAAEAEKQRIAALTPQQKAEAAVAWAQNEAAETKKNADLNRAVALAAAIKKTANDPESIQFSAAGVTDDGSIWIEYRGKNPFGAVILNYAVSTHDGKIATGSEKQVAQLWNKYIANRSTKDIPIKGAQRLGVI